MSFWKFAKNLKRSMIGGENGLAVLLATWSDNSRKSTPL